MPRFCKAAMTSLLAPNCFHDMPLKKVPLSTSLGRTIGSGPATGGLAA